MNAYPTALQKIVLHAADSHGRIAFPQASASEHELFLVVLWSLERGGFVRQERGNIPMLPFHITPLGERLRQVVMHAKW